MTKLEELARAAHARAREIDHDEQAGIVTPEWEDTAVDIRDRYLALTRTIIEKMRNTNEAMLTAAIAPYRQGNTDEFNKTYKGVVRGYWERMIDTLLKEAS